MRLRAASAGLLLVWLWGCGKVPIVDIDAGFTLADVSWFETEQTLFVFYRVDAQQGLGPDSQVELRYRTDDVDVDWAPLSAFAPVHTHLPVDCGVNSRCGSMSLKVEKVPRSVGLRLRYRRLGQLTLPAQVSFNAVGQGPVHLTRSLLVYGVFDESNTLVQWRARHLFPTIRNEEATALGLRRAFSVEQPGSGRPVPLPEGNVYGYAFDGTCPTDFVPLNFPTRATDERAIFETTPLPLAASTAPVVCGTSTVTDALGSFIAPAIARRNPVVKAAFPTLRTPIREATQVPLVLRLCQRTISQPHFDMQVQRLLAMGALELCVDDFLTPGFANRITSVLSRQIDLLRPPGKDLVLMVVLHHDDPTGRLGGVLETALTQVLVPERGKTSPRVAGAFIFDSVGYRLKSNPLKSLVLWCPATLPTQLDLDLIPGASERDCALLPDQPDFNLGPFKFNTLPILPTRAQYSTFLTKYGPAQAGSVKTLTVLAPTLTPISQAIPLGDVGVATAFNNETFSAAPTDAFSFCPSEDLAVQRIVVNPVGLQVVVPLQSLPALHRQNPFPLYALGLGWESPFLLRMDYETQLAGNVSVATLTVPFGIASPNTKFFGAEQWKREQFPVGDALAQCTVFCEHPTFDSAGVYQVASPFADAYANQCYRPAFPKPGDGGFPRDP